jgi:hypothetical protein
MQQTRSDQVDQYENVSYDRAQETFYFFEIKCSHYVFLVNGSKLRFPFESSIMKEPAIMIIEGSERKKSR